MLNVNPHGSFLVEIALHQARGRSLTSARCVDDERRWRSTPGQVGARGLTGSSVVCFPLPCRLLSRVTISAVGIATGGPAGPAKACH